LSRVPIPKPNHAVCRARGDRPPVRRPGETEDRVRHTKTALDGTRPKDRLSCLTLPGLVPKSNCAIEQAKRESASPGRPDHAINECGLFSIDVSGEPDFLREFAAHRIPEPESTIRAARGEPVSIR